MILMCQNAAVYDIDTDRVICEKLLPGLMRHDKAESKKRTFGMWQRLRYCSNTNTIARHIRGISFGQGNRARIDKTTRALSLCDSYWLKDESDNIRFEDISPYCTSFWNGDGAYNKESIPTLYVGGHINKEWTRQLKLNKYGKETQIEYECYELCKLVGVECAEIEKIYDTKHGIGIAVSNITNTDMFLEQADMSGMIDPENFTNADIIKLFGLSGLKMMTADAIVGNTDRHAGNIGWLRDAKTGEYLKQAPLYDFDHALDVKGTRDILIDDLVETVHSVCKEYREEVNRILMDVSNSDLNTIFVVRAKEIIKRLGLGSFQ